ncbi:glycosyltransferase family 4 protein [Endozoicomonas gorgoniicola]|uniref:Glycosyltransferase family 4 protein n=1 Tax=Endozoicomonas gorgoniicola TaxID=1234144 RepID=A0ABT3MS63_9GAMM|nr:glycosyltransferase family 1 protein [Endozoicomonas gorgoniicola]MCW7552203.1 glycosyltransferase family 4 protein [Endozoicomonas gorgoniicola]
MRVGIDARLLSEPLTGIGRYTKELSDKLMDYSSQLYLYSARDIDSHKWEINNPKVRSANFQSRLGRMWWSQSYLPYWSAKDQVDVFWGATHRIPRYLPRNIARVVTIHDLVWKHAGNTMRPLSYVAEKMLMPDTIYSADRIIADSISTSKAIIDEYPAVSKKVRIVYPGTSRFPPHQEFQSLIVFGIDRPYFLFVGTLEPRKNLSRLLRAFASLDESIKKNNLLVIAGGKGWGGVDAEALIRRENLQGQVKVVGYVDDGWLATLYSHARFLAMPSLYEGFGLPLVEAMSFGVPVLTSDTSSMPEVAGEAGVLVDPLDVESIASGLTKFFGDNHRDSLAKKAEQSASRFTWEQSAKQLWAIFDEARKERLGSC